MCKKIKTNRIWLFFFPSLIGMMVFFFLPMTLMIFYAFTDVRGTFVWLANFTDVITNMAFRLAAGNSFWFLSASVVLGVFLSFILSSSLQKLKHKKFLVIPFMLPLIIPSGPVVYFWNFIFADNGAINSFLFQRGMDTVPWFTTDWSFVIVLVIFLARSVGFNMVLYLAGFQLIPKDYYEVAKIEGAGAFATFRFVTFIYILPTSFLVFMMSIINSFRVFRETYLLFGPYPHNSVYMLQHFMNNQFLFANMQRLAVTATMLSVFVIILVWGIFTGQRKISESFS